MLTLKGNESRNEGSPEPETRTGGHLFVKLLQSKEVDFVFGTTGAGMPDIQDAMVVVKPPKWIQGLHEFVTVNAASGYALVSGRVGVALIDRIVGTQNAIGAFFGAYHNSSPITVFASANLPGVPIETGAPELHYSSYQNLMGSPWLKWFTQVNALDSMAKDIDKAFHVALSEHRGPVYVSLRQDLMAKTLAVQPNIARETGLVIASPRVPDDDTVAKIVEVILSHTNPRILVSYLGRRPEAVNSLLEFAHTLGLGVLERRFFMNYPNLDPLHLGFLHRYHSPSIGAGVDLAVALEMGLLPHQDFGEGIDAIDLHSDPMHRQDVYAGGDYGSSLFPALVRASCDLGPTLDKLTKFAKLRSSSSDRQKIKERIEEVRAEHDRMVNDWREKAKSSFEANTLDGWSVGYILNKYASQEGRDNNFTLMNGAASPWDALLRTIELREPGTYFGNPSGHLGVTVGMSYGAALAYRRYESVVDKGGFKTGVISSSSRLVACVTGDGDAIFGNIDSALWTCSHYGIGVLYVIMNNACWGVEWPPIAESSQKWAQRAKDYEFLDIDSPRIDYSKVASGFGVRSHRVETAEQLDSLMPDAIRTVRGGAPVLLDVTMEKYTGPAPSVVT